MSITQTIATLPTAPDPGTPSTFETLAGPFVAALPTLGTQINTWAGQANTLASAVNADASTASTAATTATTQATTATTQATAAAASAAAAAASASSATNAANVNGTSTTSLAIATAPGQSKALTFVESSRAVVGGMFLVFADTSLPTTNWMLVQVTSWNSGTKVVTGTVIIYAGTGTITAWTISLSSARGAAGADASLTTPSLALTGTPTLVSGNNGYTGDAAASAVIALDTLSTLGDGWAVTLVPASTTSPATVTADFGAGAETKALVGPTLISIKNVSGTYTARWIPLGNVAPVLGTLGTPFVINAAATACAAAAGISSTRFLAMYTSTSNYPRVALCSSAAVLSTSGDIEAVALSGATPQMVWLTSTTAIMIWATSGVVKVCVVQDNAGTAAYGNVLTVDSVTSACQCIIRQSATRVTAVYSDSSGSTKGCSISISGTTSSKTTGGIYTLNASASIQIRGAARSATEMMVIAVPSGTPNILQAIPVTDSAGAFTFPAAMETIAKCGSANNTAYGDVVAVSSTRYLVAAGNDVASTGSAFVFPVDATGTGTSALVQVGVQRPVHTPGSNLSCHRLASLSANTTLHLASVSTSALASILQALHLEADSVRAGTGRNVARKVTTHQDLALMGTNIAVAVYADGGNSGYPTAVAIPTGSVQ